MGTLYNVLQFFALLVLNSGIFQLLPTVDAQSGYTWNRSALIYHNGNRGVNNWKRHLLRISDDGSFTDKWLFDHAIVTSGSVMWTGDSNGGNVLNDLLGLFFQDAKDIDSVLKSLPKRATAFQISIGLPYVNAGNYTITLDGKGYNPSKSDERLAIYKWYINKVNEYRLSGNLQFSKIIGIYYHSEDVIDVDVESVQGINNYVHELGLKSTWVPYYSAPNQFQGRSVLGFDVVVVQPNYAFDSAIDGGCAKGDRLYSLAAKSVELQQCYEYEVRSPDSLVGYSIAHQYLAVAQQTGAWKFPQVFFAGGDSDLFDRIESKSVADGHSWQAYTDLADYLEGKNINNLELAIALNPNKKRRIGAMDIWETSWTVPQLYSGLSSIRLDFKDDSAGYWTGAVYVYIERPDGTTGSSFTFRREYDGTVPSNSVFVPLADKNVTEFSVLTVTIQKTTNSKWPIVLRLVAAKFEPLFIANPIYEEVAFSPSNSCPSGIAADSVPSHRGFARGKLTDGKKSSSGIWDVGGIVSAIVAWSKSQFFVTIDLEKVFDISNVQILAHEDRPYSGFYKASPLSLVALVSASCIPHITGTTEFNCIADASSGKQEMVTLANPTDKLITLPFIGNARGRFVSISGYFQTTGLLDEIQVLDANNTVVSVGKPYRVTPMSGFITNNNYCDDSRRLTDGHIVNEYIFATAPYDGIIGNGTVQTLFDKPKSASYAVVWITEENGSYGVRIPSFVNIQWRNSNNVWSAQKNVIPMSATQCGPAPCAKLQLPTGASVTGIKATFPSTGELYMITEISIM